MERDMNWVPQSIDVVEVGRRTFWAGFGRRVQAKKEKRETEKPEGMHNTMYRVGQKQAEGRG